MRPQFATLPGLTSPPPFGGSQRTIVIRVDPDRLRSYGMSPGRGDPRGLGGQRDHAVWQRQHRRRDPDLADELRRRRTSTICSNCRSAPAPGRRCRSATSARVSDSTDIPTAYALVNGRRAVYIPVTKRPNASTLSVVSEVKANLGRFQALVPDDIKVSYELDQSRNVSASLQAVLREAALGALLTGLMVLVFLRDWRSAGDRRRDDSVRAARRGDRVVGRGPDHQRHDARRPGAGGRHSGR